MKMKLNFQSDPDMCEGLAEDRVIAKITPLDRGQASEWRVNRRKPVL